MADNTILSTNVGTGNTIRTLEDGTSIHWPVGVVAYATSTGTPDVLTIPTAAALADNTANPTTLLGGSCLLIFDGTTWDRAPGTSADGLLVNLGANNDVTVTGTVAVTQSGTWNIGTVTTVTAVTAITNALPAGTNAIGKLAANSGVDIGDVDVTSIAAGDNNIGNVDIASALPAGTNNIGDVDVASIAAGDNAIGRVKLTDGTDVADVLDLTNSNPLTVAIVDGSGTQITSFGGGTQYTEGDTDASITGTAMLWEDTSDTLRSVSAAKPLPVNIISGAGSGGTAIQDGNAFTPDTTNLTPIGGYRDDAAPATVTEGDAASARITEFRALHVNLRDASGTELAVGGGTQYTEDAAAAANPVGNAIIVVRDDARGGSLTTGDGDNVALRGTNAGELYVKHVDTLPVTQSGTWNITNVSGTVSLPTGASTAAKQPALGTAGSASSDVITIQGVASMTPVAISDNSGSLTVDNGGTFAVQAAQSGTWNITNVSGTVSLPTGAATETTLAAAAASLSVMDDWDNAASDGASVSGDVAHDTADAGEPVKIGTKAIATLSTQTLVTANDRSNAFSDLDGVLLTRRGATLGDRVRGLAAITDGSSTSVISTAGSGVKIYITDVIIANSSASFVTVDLRDGTGGSVLATFPVPATGGVCMRLETPIGFSADTAVAADPSAAASTVTVTLLGFKSKI